MRVILRLTSIAFGLVALSLGAIAVAAALDTHNDIVVGPYLTLIAVAIASLVAMVFTWRQANRR
jgi:adenine deaminase